MTFNFEAAEAFGFTNVTPQAGTGKGHLVDCDVNVTESNSRSNKRYRFSFSEDAYKKLGSRVACVVSPDRKRIYFAPHKNGYEISIPKQGSGYRPFFSVAKSRLPLRYNIAGQHKLLFSKDMNGYFIEASTESE